MVLLTIENIAFVHASFCLEPCSSTIDKDKINKLYRVFVSCLKKVCLYFGLAESQECHLLVVVRNIYQGLNLFC